MIMDAATKSTLKQVNTGIGHCREVRWNPGENMLLVLHHNGALTLVSTEDERQVQEFDKG